MTSESANLIRYCAEFAVDWNCQYLFLACVNRKLIYYSSQAVILWTIAVWKTGPDYDWKNCNKHIHCSLKTNNNFGKEFLWPVIGFFLYRISNSFY